VYVPRKITAKSLRRGIAARSPAGLSWVRSFWQLESIFCVSFHYHFRVAANLSAVKCRLHQRPLPSPEFALAGEQPFAEEAWVQSHAHTFHKVVVASRQQVLDVIRMD